MLVETEEQWKTNGKCHVCLHKENCIKSVRSILKENDTKMSVKNLRDIFRY